MLGSLPAMIDPIQLADTGQRLSGTLTVETLRRLTEAGVGENGSVNIDLSFMRDTSSGLRQVQGTISATLSVVCQRCLETMEIVLCLQPRMFLLRPNEEKGLPAGEADFLVIDKPIAISKLVEDELLLALPMYPVHIQNRCQARKMIEKSNKQQKTNPFAVLRPQKKADN